MYLHSHQFSQSAVFWLNSRVTGNSLYPADHSHACTGCDDKEWRNIRESDPGVNGGFLLRFKLLTVSYLARRRTRTQYVVVATPGQLHAYPQHGGHLQHLGMVWLPLWLIVVVVLCGDIGCLVSAAAVIDLNFVDLAEMVKVTTQPQPARSPNETVNIIASPIQYQTNVGEIVVISF